MKRLALTLAVAVALVAPASSSAARSPAKLAPPVPCVSANRMDIFVDEDNILWECSCEMLKTGNICRWQVIGGVDAVRIRSKIRRHALPPRFWYHARGRYLTVPRAVVA